MLLLNLNTIHQESFLDCHNEFRWLELKINEFENVHGTKDHPNLQGQLIGSLNLVCLIFTTF